jgi:hypothetical protein
LNEINGLQRAKKTSLPPLGTFANGHPENRPSSFNVQKLYDQIMKRDGCVTPVDKKYLAQLDEDLSGSDSGAQMGWSVFRERAKAILEIPCDVPGEWVMDEAQLRVSPPRAVANVAAAWCTGACAQEEKGHGDRWIDQYGFIHRGPAGTRSQLPNPH